MTAFEYHTDPWLNKVFNQGMSNHSTIMMKRLLETYNGFEGISTLVDVGGGTGATLNMIIAKYPSIKGINFDLPHVVDDALSYNDCVHLWFNKKMTCPICRRELPKLTKVTDTSTAMAREGKDF